MASILNLSPRMEAITNLCDRVSCIADIGCDHGYITAELILQEKVDKVIATDVSEKCLNKAIRLCDSMNIAYFVSFREGNGFEVITKRDKVKQAVIAGMGGQEIINILEKRPKKLYDFVLQPQSDVIMLRKYLIENGFQIVMDYLQKEDNRYYNIIKVTKLKKEQQISNLELYFGANNFRENYQIFYEYLTERFLFLNKLKTKFGELNHKNEEEWYFVNEALKLYGVSPEQILKEHGLLSQESKEIKQEKTIEEDENENLDEKLEFVDNVEINNQKLNSNIETENNDEGE